MNRLAIVLIIAIILLAGCNQIATQQVSTNPSIPTTYPAPPTPQEYNPGYPVPSQAIIIESTPTISSGTGMVHGVIYNNGTALQSSTFFLASTLKDEKGQEIATSLDRSTAPRAVSDNNGNLNFYNVQPGRYGLVLASGMNTYLLLYPDNGKAILFSVTPGANIDLGKLNFTDLPIN